MCALIHDIGDVLTPHNHPDLAAAVLKPFVSEENHWMVAHHDVFQAITFGIILGETVMREMRLKDMHSMTIAKNSADYTMHQLSTHHTFDPLEHCIPRKRIFHKNP